MEMGEGTYLRAFVMMLAWPMAVLDAGLAYGSILGTGGSKES